MPIEEGFEGFPVDADLIDAIVTCDRLHQVAIALCRMEPRYAQMIIDHLGMLQMVAKEPLHKECVAVLISALNTFLDSKGVTR